jgi:hypothetical protein
MAYEASVVALSDHGFQKKYLDRGPILAYKNSILWREDTRGVLPGRFMEDNLLVFWIEHLAHEVYSGRSELCFLHPGAFFMILQNSVEDIADGLQVLALQDRQLILIPLSSDREAGQARALLGRSGAHRSLLVWVKREDKFYHYDPGKGRPNKEVAERVAHTMWGVLLKATFRDRLTPFTGLATPAIPPMRDASDSGVYVCFLLNALCFAGSTIDLGPLLQHKTIARYRAHMSVILAHTREEYAQLKGDSMAGRKPEPSMFRPGGDAQGRPPVPEDLESVPGWFEDTSVRCPRPRAFSPHTHAP